MMQKEEAVESEREAAFFRRYCLWLLSSRLHALM